MSGMPSTQATQPSFPPRWLVLVGGSGAEGLRQMAELLGLLPPGLPAAVLLVLHRPPDKPSHLPEILGRATKLPVRVPSQGEALAPGVCYVGLPDRHLRVADGPVADMASDHVHRSNNIDLLFECAAKLRGCNVLGVVLAGALRDGAQGLSAIKQAGGAAMIVDADWSWREGMPRAARLAVPDADAVASVAEIAAQIVGIVGSPCSARRA